MFSHITHGIRDLTKATNFYDAALGALNVKRFWSDDSSAGYGIPRETQLWLVPPFDGQPARAGNGHMTAFEAQTRAEVDAFYKAALDHGGSDEGAPGLRPQYHEHYYGCYVRDPDGQKLCCVCHQPEA